VRTGHPVDRAHGVAPIVIGSLAGRLSDNDAAVKMHQ
jgi:hypothetical protein